MAPITTRNHLVAALWDIHRRIDPAGVGMRCEYSDDEAADLVKRFLQALLDSDLGAKTKPSDISAEKSQ